MKHVKILMIMESQKFDEENFDSFSLMLTKKSSSYVDYMKYMCGEELPKCKPRLQILISFHTFKCRKRKNYTDVLIKNGQQ